MSADAKPVLRVARCLYCSKLHEVHGFGLFQLLVCEKAPREGFALFGADLVTVEEVTRG